MITYLYNFANIIYHTSILLELTTKQYKCRLDIYLNLKIDRFLSSTSLWFLNIKVYVIICLFNFESVIYYILFI